MFKNKNPEIVQPINNKPTDKERNSERVITNRLRLAGAFAAVIATAGALTTHDSGEGKVAEASVSETAMPLTDYEKKVQTDVESNPTIRQAKIVLHEGVKLRSEPQMQNGSGAGEKGNVILTIDNGQVAVIENPVVYTNQANQEFYGSRDAAGDYFWVNAQQLLADENVSGKSYIDIINDPQIIEPTVAGVFENGQFRSDAIPGQELATISIVPETSAADLPA